MEVTAGARFRPQHRLLRAAEYNEVFGHRRVLRGTLLDLHVGPGAGGGARLGLVVPKRHAALAVTRNYCKRVAREWFRHRRAELPSFDMILRLARPAGKIGRGALGQTLRDDLDKLLRRLPR